MKLVQFVAVSLVVMCFGAFALAGDEVSLPAPTNAALVHWRVWAFIPDDIDEAIDKEFNGRELTWTPSAELSTKLNEMSSVTDQLVQASTMAQCDFGIEYSRGRSITLPHLDKMRLAARILVCDCRRLLDAGKVDESVSRAVALFALARQVRQDQVIVSSSIAQGFSRMAADEVTRFCNDGRITAAHRASLAQALDAIKGDDPFHFADAVRMEGRMNLQYLSQFKGASAGAEFFRSLAKGAEPDVVSKAIQDMDDKALKVSGEKALEYFDKVADAWSRPDAPELLQKLEDSVLALEFGPVAVLIAPGMVNARANETEQLRIIGEARKLLESGPRQPEPKGPVAPLPEQPTPALPKK